MAKIIFHLDLNYFFCRCEEIINPQLADQPFIVSERALRSVVSTSNPKARALGIYAALPLRQALKIEPKLVIVENHRDLYVRYSYAFFNCLRNYFTDEIEITSIDECYLDATNLIAKYHNNYMILAQTIINKVYEVTKLYVTVGVGNNKIQAKMAGDTKPINKIYAIFDHEVQAKIWPLAINKLLMVGKKTGAVLNQLGIYKVVDFIKYPNQELLKQTLKKLYFTLSDYANGISDDVIVKEIKDNKSLSHTHTFGINTNTKREILIALKIMIDSLHNQLLKHQWVTNTVVVNIKYDYETSHSHSMHLKQYTNDLSVLTNHFLNLFETHWDQETSIRAISVACQHLITSTQVVKQNKLDL